MRRSLTNLNLRNSSGAISKMLIINIILAVLIISALWVLLNIEEQNSALTSPKPVVNTPEAKPANSTGQVVETQSEIDELRAQLELETSKLGDLREDKKRIEEIREASDAASRILETPEVKTDDADDAAVENLTE